eukprot:c19472_g1_i3.p1 GENE.c19472_g1_i3~~c19472_g1_i3.p1  ORF type:complete len:283 (+),score=16.94 c19472_g1_i3:243-1091(+)
MTPGHLESEIWNHQVLGHRPRHIFTITFSLTDQISNMHNLSPSCQGCHEQHIVLISERASFKSSQPRPVFPFPSASSRWQVFHRVNIQDPEVFREHFSFSGQSDNTFISFVCWRGQQRGYGVSFLWDGRPSRFVVVSVIAGMDFVVGRGRGLCCNLSSSSQRNDETVFGRAFQSTVHTKLDTQPGHFGECSLTLFSKHQFDAPHNGHSLHFISFRIVGICVVPAYHSTIQRNLRRATLPDYHRRSFPSPVSGLPAVISLCINPRLCLLFFAFSFVFFRFFHR